MTRTTVVSRPLGGAVPRKGSRHSGRAQLDSLDDPYKQSKKRRGLAVCEQCGAVYQDGRWQWSKTPLEQDAEWTVCQACHRIHDYYPAGELILSGAYVDAHRNEIVSLARHQETAERTEHPLNRIMEIGSATPGTLMIRTTDIHLPKRIGDAIRHAHGGTLRTHFDKQGYFIRVTWRHDAEEE